MFSQEISVIMAMIVELAQRMLTKQPTVPRASAGAIRLAASKPTRASEPLTEMMRPKDDGEMKFVIVEKIALSRPG
jgi:hypothetical protein